MTQQEVLKYLKRNKQGTAKEIAEALNKSKVAIYFSLSQLRKYKEIKCKIKKIKNKTGIRGKRIIQNEFLYIL